MAVADPITRRETFNPLKFSKSLSVWSTKTSEQINIGITKIIEPKWNQIKENPDVVQTCIKNSLIEHRRFLQFKDPYQKVTPSFDEALYVLICMYIVHSDPNVRRFIEVGNHLQALVRKLNVIDQFLGNFACFEPTRKKYSTTLNKIKTLVFEYSTNAEMHKTFKKSSLDRAYALLFSVVPKTLENIKSIVEIICSEVRSDAKVTQEEIEELIKRQQTTEGSIVRFDHYFWFVNDEELIKENERLRALLDEKTKGFDEQACEIIELRQLLDEQRKENKNLQLELRVCKTDSSEGECNKVTNKADIPEDELDRLLRKSRQRAQKDGGMKLETNYSTSNFAYGVFDSRGGNLSIKDADVELFIPAGAISTTQEIYIYIDPKARFLNPDQDYPPQSGIEQRETRVAPIVHCGPPGTEFLSHVVLTIPHNAENEDNWQFTPVRSEGDRHSDDWQDIGTDCNDNADDDSIVIVNGGFCVFMVKHFTSFTLMKDSPN